MNEQEIKNLTIVTIIITSELYRPLLLKSLLSHKQVDNLLSEVCINCYARIINIISAKNETALPDREVIINFAKGYVLTEKGIKL